MKKKVLIIVPIYKKNFDPQEEKNVTNLVSKLDGVPMVFVAPISLNTSYYSEKFGNIGYARFENFYFDGINGYNKLMLSTELYSRFESYEYICICQPDVWVIKKLTNLERFVSQGYDYYGAPWWPSRYIYWELLIQIIKTSKRLYGVSIGKYKIRGYHKIDVGNGGFSLRHVGNTIGFLKRHEELANIWEHNEDYFFAFIARYYDEEYQVAPRRQSMELSLEKKSRYYIKYKGMIPVAVHAYAKFYPEVCEIQR